jgi:phosphoribosylglycinamide formyltransferase-1
MREPVIAILASGEGTTAEAFIQAGLAGKIKTKVALVITNKETAGILKRIEKLNKAHNLNIKTAFINSLTHPEAGTLPGRQTFAEQQAIIEAVEGAGADLVVLMGYMKMIGSKLVERFGWLPHYEHPHQAMMLNTHPGLLPDSKGLIGVHVQEFVLKNKLPYAGQTLHTVSEKYDEGLVIAEHKVKVASSDTPDSLFDKVRAVEKKFLPLDIENFIKARQDYTIQLACGLRKEIAPDAQMRKSCI